MYLSAWMILTCTIAYKQLHRQTKTSRGYYKWHTKDMRTRILLHETKNRENIKLRQCTIYHLSLHPGAQLLSFIGFAVQYSVFLSVVFLIQSIHSRFAFSPPYLFDGELFLKFDVPTGGGSSSCNQLLLT